MKALTGRQITNAFAGKARRTHHFNDIKARPGDVIAEHLYLERGIEERGVLSIAKYIWVGKRYSRDIGSWYRLI